MERDARRPWEPVTRFVKSALYWGFILVFIGNIVRISGICRDVRADMKETQTTLECLETQDAELTQKLKELGHEEGRDLEMKKRLYLKKGERWILFEHQGKPLHAPPTSATSAAE